MKVSEIITDCVDVLIANWDIEIEDFECIRNIYKYEDLPQDIIN